MMDKKKKIIIGAVAGVLGLAAIGGVINDNTADTETTSTSFVSEYKTESVTEEFTTEEQTTPTTEAPATTITTTIITTTAIPETEAPTTTTKPTTTEAPTEKKEETYVLNTNSKKVHKKTCWQAEKISPENYSETQDLEWAKSQGYDACGTCNPF